MSTDTEVRAPKAAAVKKRVDARTRQRRALVVEVAGALIAGVGAAVLARNAFGAVGLFGPLLTGYLTFVLVVVGAEFARTRGDVRADDQFIDLTAESEAPAHRLEAVPDEPAASPDLDVPVRRKRVDGANLSELLVAALGGAAFAELLRIVLRMQSTLGAFVWWYVAFMALYFILVRDRRSGEAALDCVVTVLVWSIGLLVAAALTWMLAFIVVNGIKLLTGGFFTEDLSKTGPLTPGGGAKHAIIGTLEQVGIATIIVVPVGILTAVYLHEVRGRMASPIRFIVDSMSGLPSIVAGLLVFSVWVGNHGYSGIAGAAAIAILMIPTMTRASEEILRTVPDSLREGALALGAPHWRLVQKVVLPTAIAGLLTAMLLAVARAVGETAPMLLTAFGSDSTNTNPLHGPQSDLPLFVWKLIRLPNVTQLDRAYTGALILVMLVFVFFVGARLAASRSQKRLGAGR